MKAEETAKPPSLWGPVLRYAAATLSDAVFRPKAADPHDVPAAIDAVTDAWLTSALCADMAGAVQVASHALGPLTRGTTARRRISLTYNGAPGNRDLPASLFAKSSPSFFNRISLGLSRTIENEALFYRHIRPLLTLEAPRGYHCAYDLESGRSLQLLEDLTATKGARFCTPRDRLTRPQAEDIVETLAALHARFMGSDLKAQFPWLKTHPQWFEHNYGAFGLRRYHERALVEAEPVLPQAVARRRAEIWDVHARALSCHDVGPAALLHGDVHLGNWYITCEERMGLCDWQCMSIGTFSRDLAYALGVCLAIEDRRAWERDLIGAYLAAVRRLGGPVIAFDEAFQLYRAQMLSPLLMWTPTLVHSPLMPDMQPKDVALEMIRRAGAAIDDLGSLDAA
jgi:aminoglycoside phosphotransferase (APT) family kinase protein